MIGLWHLNESSAISGPGGSDAEDSSGEGNHGNDSRDNRIGDTQLKTLAECLKLHKIAPEDADAKTQAIAGGVIAVASVFGYLKAQGDVDKEEAKKDE